MFLPETLRPLKVPAISLSILLAAGCFSTSDLPLSPNLSQDGPALDYLEQPPSPDLLGEPHCRSVEISPDDRTVLHLPTVQVTFPAGCVNEATEVEGCADPTVYAVDFAPDGTEFLVPVLVKFLVPLHTLAPGDITNLDVVHVSASGDVESVPFALTRKGPVVHIVFSIVHFSRYALVID